MDQEGVEAGAHSARECNGRPAGGGVGAWRWWLTCCPVAPPVKGSTRSPQKLERTSSSQGVVRQEEAVRPIEPAQGRIHGEGRRGPATSTTQSGGRGRGAEAPARLAARRPMGLGTSTCR